MNNGRVFKCNGHTLLQVRQGEMTCEDCTVSRNMNLQDLCQMCGSTVRKDKEDVVYLDFPEFIDRSINTLDVLSGLYPQKTLENVMEQIKAVKKEYDGVSLERGGENEFVDLGLPSGLLWATCNIGATSPEKAGLYFAWGETKGFTAEQVEAGGRDFNYNSSKVRNITGNLTLEQDAAHAYLEGKWRMPTKAEWQELIDNCNIAWKDDFNGTGAAGRVFTSKTNGNYIFLPAAGYCYDSSVSYIGSDGYYWSASWDSERRAWSLDFNFRGVSTVSYYDRYYGHSVRAVCESVLLTYSHP